MENAVIATFGNEISLHVHQKVRALSAYLDDQPFSWMIEYVPAFTTVTIFFDMKKISYAEAKCAIDEISINLKLQAIQKPRLIDIPVYYNGPDLEVVARENQITTDEVVNIHTSGDYLVYMIGFAPGFPYIGGMSEKIAAPRRESPRLRIPAGSVGIAGHQTGVYPIETPGGWQLIGQTPLPLFRPHDLQAPSLLQTGDKIRFTAMTEQEFMSWEEKNL